MKNIYLFLALFIVLSLPAQTPKIQLITFATGLSSPIDIKHCGDTRLFVVEQRGKIKIVNENGTVRSTPFLNIDTVVHSSGSEQGLLAMAFSPNFKNDGYFFVNYTAGSGSGSSYIARYSISANDSNLADANSKKIILKFTQPYTNHNGCDLRFGPDGYLYASFGDGGSQGDPNANGQNTNTYLAKILRIDPFNGTTYTIPATNPFYGQAGKKQEIWAYGLRNPWRCSFDRLTGDYWIGDVGGSYYEEIDYQPANSAGGENYGWRCYEGNSTNNTSGCSTTINDFTFPVFDYIHSGANGCSVTGGYVYRGAQYKNMFGKYFFADYCSGRIWCIEKEETGFITTIVGDYTAYQYSSFGENYLGDLFVTGHGNGRVYKITDTSSCKPVAFLGFTDTIYACENTFTLNTLPGNGLSYSWMYNSQIIPGDSGNAYTTSQSGQHIVIVTNTAMCSNTDTVQLILNNNTLVNITGLKAAYCITESAIALTANVNGGEFTINDTLSTLFNPAALGTGNFVVKYTYTNSYGCTTTDTNNVTVSICTGILENINTQNNFQVFPNPGSGTFNLNIVSSLDQVTNVNIYNILGENSYQKNISIIKGKQQFPLDLEGLPVGIYFVRLSGEGWGQIVKLSISK